MTEAEGRASVDRFVWKCVMELGLLIVNLLDNKDLICSSFK